MARQDSWPFRPGPSGGARRFRCPQVRASTVVSSNRIGASARVRNVSTTGTSPRRAPYLRCRRPEPICARSAGWCHCWADRWGAPAPFHPYPSTRACCGHPCRLAGGRVGSLKTDGAQGMITKHVPERVDPEGGGRYVHPGWLRGAFLSLLVLPPCLPVAASPIVRVSEQERSTFVAVDVDYWMPFHSARADSAINFGSFESSLDVDGTACVIGAAGAHAEQSSVIVGDSIVARGGTTGYASAPDFTCPPTCAGRSDFFVRLRVDTLTTYHLSCRAGSSARRISGAGFGGVAGVVVSLLGRGRGLAVADSSIVPHPDCFPDPWLCADSLLMRAVGELLPGEYELRIHSWIEGYGTDLGRTGLAASYDLVLVFGGPLVRVQPASWTRLKTLFR